LRLFKLIDEGYIVPWKVLTLPVHIDLNDVHQSQQFGEQDYSRRELDSTMAPYYEAIAELIVEHAPNRQIVAFLPLIQSSIEFVQVCRSLGIKAEHVDHKSTDREEKLQRFENRDFQLISNSSLLTTGWDCPPRLPP
jgi:superfamily II DNA or RNA helicase